MSDLVRIGTGSLWPTRNEGRWSEEQAGWRVTGYYGYIEPERLEDILDYQTYA